MTEEQNDNVVYDGSEHEDKPDIPYKNYMNLNRTLNDSSSKQEDKPAIPMMSSNNMAAWLKQDKNGDYYLIVRADLGLLGTHSAPLFMNDKYKEYFNNLAEHFIVEEDIDV